MSSSLPLLYERRLGHSIETELAAYCDVHDLIATVHSSTGDVVVYRINGQVAFSIKGRRVDADAEVTAVKWKSDGSFLGLGWSDGMCGVYSGENGKLLSQSSVSVEQGQDDWKLDLTPDLEIDSHTTQIAICVGWTAYPSQAKISSRAEHSSAAEELLDSSRKDLQNGDAGEEANRIGIGELVESITTLDVTKVLPQLSSIPLHSTQIGHGNKFSTQTGVDSIFETRKDASNSIDTLITSGKEGCTNVLLDESVKIGSFDLQSRSLVHASHPQCDSQVILSKTTHDGKFRLHYIDLPLETLGSPLLHVIATNTKRLQNLTAYVAQTVRCIQHDFTTGLQFPTRLMSNISDELSEKEEGDLVTNLYHLAMTGSFTPTILEWLIDVVKETNLKRWEQAGSTMYTNIRDHLFINLLPALDRLSVAASALRGHARLHEGTSKFDVSPELFTTLLDEIDSLRLVAQKMLLVVMRESRQFRAFCKWMRVMIEVGIAGPATKGATETEEREVPNLDYSLLLAYIKDTMTGSRLAVHVEQRPDLKGSCDMQEFFGHPTIAQMERKHTIKALEALDGLKPGEELQLKDVHDPSSLINLPALTARLSAQVRLAVDSITTWQSKMLPSPTTTTLHLEADATIFDLRIFPHGEHRDSVTNLLIKSHSTQRNKLHLCQIVHPKLSKKCEAAEREFEVLDGDILKAKMLDERRCVVLLHHDDGRYMLLSCDLEGYEKQRSIWLTGLHVLPANSTFVSHHDG